MRILAAAIAATLSAAAASSAQEQVERASVGARELVESVLQGDVLADCLPELRLADAEIEGRPRPSAPVARAPAARVVLAFDSSGSMAARMGAPTKMETARRAAEGFLADLPPEVEVGLVVFGHRGDARNEGKNQSCSGVEAVRPLGTDRPAVRAAIDALRPAGWTPLASAMEAAAREFRPSEREGEQVLLVVSDGVETCGGDPVAVARRLNGGPMRVVVDIVGFDIAGRERAALAAVAEAGGGRFLNVANREAAEEAFRRSRERTLDLIATNRAQTAATIATNRTQTAATIASNRAQTCATIAMNREATAFTTRTNRLFGEGRLERGAYSEARATLDARHAELRAGVREYVEAVRAVSADRVSAIRQRLDEALRR